MTNTSNKTVRKRGEAFAGSGHGTLRRQLQECARDQIERSLSLGFYCEAIALSESIIADRLESRLSFLSGENAGFRNLGGFGKLKRIESDDELRNIYAEVDQWARRRNRALHEMVKVEAKKPPTDWATRMRENRLAARDGYEIAKRIYHRVADLNPRHADRVLPRPLQKRATSLAKNDGRL
jgi:hypothetical protein